MNEASETITQGTLRTSSGRVLPLEATEVLGSIAGPVADVVVRQRFRNTGADPIEAVYLFPLPHEASVYRMQFRIEDRIVRAVVKEKAEARQAYERARSEGRAATLLEEDRPSLFTLSVANIAPGAVIDVELAYQEVVAFDDGHFRFVFPMVAPERYRESNATPGTLAPPRMPSGERPPDVALSVTVHAAGVIETLRCSSHRTETQRLPDGGVAVRLPQDGPIPNRDFVLSWQASGSGVRPRLCFERMAGETGTFLLLVTPSEPRDDGRGMAQDQLRALRCGNCGGTITDMSAIKDIPGVGPVVPCKYCGAILAPGTEPVTRALQPRDLVILVDRSASMRSSVTQARRAVLALLSSLPLGDGVQLFAFDHDCTPFDGSGTSFLALSPELIAQADRFLSSLGPRGGTELEAALERAGSLSPRAGRTRAVVLVTDATIGNEGRLLRRIPQLIGSGARLYVLGVGAAVDRRLVARLAQTGGGAHDVILPNEDVEVTLTRFARRVREGGPILRDLGVFWEGSGMVDAHPTPVPDLFGGQPLRILGRYDGSGPTRLVITGRTVHDKPYRQEIDVDLPVQTNEVPGLARLWARQHVEALAAQLAAEPHRRELQAQALELSLRHAIVGPYTSLVAEDSAQVVKPGSAKRVDVGMAKTDEEDDEDEQEEEEEEEEDAPAAALGSAREKAASRSRGGVLGFEAHDDDTDEELLDLGRAMPGAAPAALESPHERLMSLPVGAAAPAAPRPKSIDVGEELHEERGGKGVVAKLRSFFGGGGAPEREALERAERASRSAPQAKAAPAARSGAPPPARPGAPPPLGAMRAPPPASASYGAPPPPAADYGPPPAPGGYGAPPPPGPGFGPPLSPAPAFGPPPPAPAASPAPRPMPATGAPPPPPPPPPPMMRSSAPASPPGYGPPPAAYDGPAGFSPPPTYGAPEGFAPPPPAYAAPPPQAPPAAAQSSLEPEGSEPYPEQEMRTIQQRIRGELDLVFCVDATGSMGPHIREVQRHLLSLVESLRASPLCKSLRVGVVSYRDHPPQESSYVSRALPLTDDIQSVRNEVARLSAQGGGDGPEAVTDGLFELVRLDWRPGAAKAVVWFGDAPPHGVEPEGDGFPDGCPCGHHWFTQAESCREMGIAVYAIGCYPTLGHYAGAEDVYRQVARVSRGLFLPLRDAELLVTVIAGAAVSELDRQRIDEHVADLAALYADALSRTDEAERVRWLTEGLRVKGVRPRAVQLDARRQRGAPLRFRDIEPADVEGALFRLRATGRAVV